MLFWMDACGQRRAGVREATAAAAKIAAFFVLFLSVFGAFSPAASWAQTPDIIEVDYLDDATGLVTTATGNINSGIAFISVTARYIGEDSLLTSESESGPSLNAVGNVGVGTSFIVRPIIDPELRLTYRLVNRSLENLTAISYTLPDVEDLYFNRDSSAFPIFSDALNAPVQYFNPVLGVTGQPISGRFRTVVFQALASQTGLTFGNDPEGSNTGVFTLAINVPGAIANQPGQPPTEFGGIINVNDEALPENFSAPEPGSAVLLLAGAFAVLVSGQTLLRRQRSCPR
ncbi:MAG: hypothetical protein H7Z41_12715 [Cytophagales bacterium]|nr:hypothetical protein [Armatimonadota bacterium]